MISGIIVALPEELASLTSEKLNKGDFSWLNSQVLIAYAGAGAANAETAAKQLIAQGAQQLISWGCAAALTEQLKSGDLVVADSLEDEQGNMIVCDKNWQNRVVKTLNTDLNVVNGKMADSSRIIASTREKKDFNQRTSALALDMESFAVARICLDNNIPFVTIRAIADPVDFPLPQAVDQAMEASGEINFNKLIRHILLHLWEIPALIRLGLHFKKANHTLKATAAHLQNIC